MIVKYDSKEYTLDLDEITVEQARRIKQYAGYTLRGLEEGLVDADPDAMTCLFWLMVQQSGEDHAIGSVSFKIVRFAAAIMAAQEAEKPDVPKEDDASAPVKRSKKSAS